VKNFPEYLYLALSLEYNFDEMKKLITALSPFSKDWPNLKKFWWHRLFIVLFWFLIIIVFAIAYFSFSSINELPLNQVDIKNNLRKYASTQSKGETNDLIPGFLALPGELGELDNTDKKVTRIYTNLSNSICNNDIVANIDSVAAEIKNKVSAYKTDDVNELAAGIKKKIETDRRNGELGANEKVYCLISQDDTTALSPVIIKFQPNFLFYLRNIVLAGITALIGSYIVQFLYYKIFLYVIFGD
jgi:hypothetical protein